MSHKSSRGTDVRTISCRNSPFPIFFWPLSRPVRELRGFERVTLAAREKKTVHFSLGNDELTYWSTGRKDWVEEPATFDVWVGGDSTASLHANFNITD
jgi:beta-glucosidase